MNQRENGNDEEELEVMVEFEGDLILALENLDIERKKNKELTKKLEDANATIEQPKIKGEKDKLIEDLTQ